MKVFISFSGDRSRAVATALCRLIKRVIQRAEPWMSETGLPIGKQWVPFLSAELKNTNFGIICLTPENLEKPYLLFEAGALAKQVETAFVVPYLFQLKPADVKDPLATFQGVSADKKGTREVLAAINKALDKDALSSEDFKVTFNKWWPDLKAELDRIPPELTERKRQRSTEDMVEEILQLVRNLAGSSALKREHVVPTNLFIASATGRTGVPLRSLGGPVSMLELYGLTPESRIVSSEGPVVAPRSARPVKTEEGRLPEKAVEENPSSGQAEARKGTEKGPRRHVVPRGRR